jgi:hypothetical protein
VDSVGLRHGFRRALAYRALQREARVPGSTLQSKIRFKMAWDRNPLITTFADKIAVRSFIESRIGADYLVPIWGVFDRAEQIDFSALPREFALKVNHGSGGVIIVSEEADRESRLPQLINVGWERFTIHPDSLDRDHAVAVLNHWLGMSFEWWPGRTPEWAYRHVQPQILIEKFLNSNSEDGLVEYKAYVAHGVVLAFRLIQGSVTGIQRAAFFTREFERLPVRYLDKGFPHFAPWESEVTPAFGADFVALAEQLMTGIDFGRVDCIVDNGVLRVGEITNYPTAGEYTYIPESFNAVIGRGWNPNYKHKG